MTAPAKNSDRWTGLIALACVLGITLVIAWAVIA